MQKYSRHAPFAHEATMDADDNAAAVLSALTEVRAEMHALASPDRPAYEYTVPRSFGGIGSAAPYQITAPFTTPCEVSVIGFTNLGGDSGVILLTTEQLINAQLVSLTGTAALADGPFMIFANLFNQSIAPAPGWYPLSGATTLYLHMTSTIAKSVYCTLQFRRRINPAGVPSQGYP